MADPTIFRAPVAADEYLAERIKPEVDDVIYLLQPSATPLTNLSRGLRSKVTRNAKYQWLKDQILPFRTESAVTTNATVGTINVDSNIAFPIGTIAYVVDSGEHMLITGRDGAGTILVTRGVGETAQATIATDYGIYALGRAYKEDETLGSIYMTKTTVDFNYTQIFRTPIGASGRDIAANLFGGKNRQHQRMMAGIAHRRDIENAYLWGERKLTSTSGGTKRLTTTRGVLKWISSNTTDCSGTITETLLDDALRGVAVYDDGPTDRLLLASDLLIQAIGSFAKAKGTYSLESAHKQYGVTLINYLSPFGRLHVAKASQTMLGSYGSATKFSGFGVLLDMNDLRRRFYLGRDTRLLPNRQENDRDGWRDEYLSDLGLEVHFEEKHATIYDFDSYA